MCELRHLFVCCGFHGNEANIEGGGIYAWILDPRVNPTTARDRFNRPTLTNCLFYDNDAGTYGGGIAMHRFMTLTNCTLANNYCGTCDSGGGVYQAGHGDETIIKNSIMWGNTAGTCTSTDEGQNIAYTGGNKPDTVTNTCIKYLSSWIGSGNTANDPLFDDFNNDDYHLDPVDCGLDSCSSKSIDRGDDDAKVNLCADGDLDSNDRCKDLDNRADEVDMGSQETQTGP